MMLRRTKLERADDLGLPPRTLVVRRDYFSPEEKEIYSSLFSDVKRQFSSYIAAGTVLNNCASSASRDVSCLQPLKPSPFPTDSNIFSLITRMRQASCHPDLVLRSKTATYIEDLDETTLCRICQEVGEDVIKAKCGHCFDRECISTYLTGYGAGNQGGAPCPVCNASLTIDLEADAIDLDESNVKKARQGILGRLDVANWRSSTKVEALVEELSKLRAEDVTTKSLVFSQFVSFRAFSLTFPESRLAGHID
jgi:DNA repair protein RAD16